MGLRRSGGVLPAGDHVKVRRVGAVTLDCAEFHSTDEGFFVLFWAIPIWSGRCKRQLRGQHAQYTIGGILNTILRGPAQGELAQPWGVSYSRGSKGSCRERCCLGVLSRAPSS